jgi:hypothetical protein
MMNIDNIQRLHHAFAEELRRVQTRARTTLLAVTILTAGCIWMLGAQERREARLYRAVAPIGITQTAEQVGIEVIAFLRDVGALSALNKLQSIDPKANTNQTWPAANALRLIVEWLSLFPRREQEAALKKLLALAPATSDDNFLNAMDRLWALPAPIRHMILENNALILRELEAQLGSEKDLALTRRKVREDLTRLKCEAGALDDATALCHRRRGVESLQTR